jgi:predicted RNase H-like HicB family nuclease
MKNHFTAVYMKEGKWWIGYVEELPGANTQGATIEEARENLKDAVEMIIEANRELSEKEMSGKRIIKEDLLISV